MQSYGSIVPAMEHCGAAPPCTSACDEPLGSPMKDASNMAIPVTASADDWRAVFEPVITRYRNPGRPRHFRADAAVPRRLYRTTLDRIRRFAETSPRAAPIRPRATTNNLTIGDGETPSVWTHLEQSDLFDSSRTSWVRHPTLFIAKSGPSCLDSSGGGTLCCLSKGSAV